MTPDHSAQPNPPRSPCDHVCMKEADHEGPHSYGYVLGPYSRSRMQAALTPDPVSAQRERRRNIAVVAALVHTHAAHCACFIAGLEDENANPYQTAEAILAALAAERPQEVPSEPRHDTIIVNWPDGVPERIPLRDIERRLLTQAVNVDYWRKRATNAEAARPDSADRNGPAGEQVTPFVINDGKCPDCGSLYTRHQRGNAQIWYSHCAVCRFAWMWADPTPDSPAGRLLGTTSAPDAGERPL